MEVREFDVRLPSRVQALQWVGDIPELVAQAIVKWVNRAKHRKDAAVFIDPLDEIDPKAVYAHPLGDRYPESDTWGRLFVNTFHGPVEVPPRGFVVKDSGGAFFVVPEGHFLRVFQEIPSPQEDLDVNRVEEMEKSK